MKTNQRIQMKQKLTFEVEKLKQYLTVTTQGPSTIFLNGRETIGQDALQEHQI